MAAISAKWAIGNWPFVPLCLFFKASLKLILKQRHKRTLVLFCHVGIADSLLVLLGCLTGFLHGIENLETSRKS